MKKLSFAVVLLAGARQWGVWKLLEPEDSCAQYFLADAAYDANRLRERLKELEIEAVIPSNPSRSCEIPFDRDLYKARHTIECFINKMKWFRRIATRYDKLDTSYLGFVHFACCLIWLR